MNASGETTGHDGVPTGNTYDKYGSRNPVARLMMAGFERDLAALVSRARPEGVLDVGCGEGVMTQWLADRLPGRGVVGVDLEDPKLAAHWAERERPGLRFETARADRLPAEDASVDTVTSLEVLEHVPDPRAALAEMARVARRWVLVSVPREPLWRVLNLARGAYVKDLGNTPGHINHWSRRSFERLVGEVGTVEAVRAPIPWTMALVRVNR